MKKILTTVLMTGIIGCGASKEEANISARSELLPEAPVVAKVVNKVTDFLISKVDSTTNTPVIEWQESQSISQTLTLVNDVTYEVSYGKTTCDTIAKNNVLDLNYKFDKLEDGSYVACIKAINVDGDSKLATNGPYSFTIDTKPKTVASSSVVSSASTSTVAATSSSSVVSTAVSSSSTSPEPGSYKLVDLGYTLRNQTDISKVSTFDVDKLKGISFTDTCASFGLGKSYKFADGVLVDQGSLIMAIYDLSVWRSSGCNLP